jgi:hypothetical protein
LHGHFASHLSGGRLDQPHIYHRGLWLDISSPLERPDGSIADDLDATIAFDHNMGTGVWPVVEEGSGQERHDTEPG